MSLEEKEILTTNTLNNKEYKMHQFSVLCKNDFLLICNKCSKILCSSSLIDKLLRLSTGNICFIIEEKKNNNSKLIENFEKIIYIENKNNVFIKDKDFGLDVVRKIHCKNCNSFIGLKIILSDNTKKFMINRFLLKFSSVSLLEFDDLGIKSYNFNVNREEIKSIDSFALEIEKYVKKSRSFINNFYNNNNSQDNEFEEIEKSKRKIDKLDEMLQYLMNNNYI